MDGFPRQPIRLITFEPKGSVDFVARLVAQGISGALGQPIIVDNRPGLVSIEMVAKAAPDGYTLLHFGPSIWTAPLVQKVGYDLEKDLAPITWVISQPNVVVVNPQVPANSVAELLALARAKPGTLKYASGINGASSQLAGELFTALADVDIVGVPYENTAQLGVADLIAGKVDMMIYGANSAMRQVRAGKLKALAITSAQPSPLFATLPTVAATVPGYESTHDEPMYAPAGTPREIIERIQQEVSRFLNTPDAKAQLSNVGMVAICSTPEALAAKGKAEMTKWGKVVKDIGIGN